MIVEYYIHYITINFHVDDDVMGKKHALSSRDARERSIRCAEPRRSSILGVGSWRPFWFDHIFRSMIFGQVIAKIRHGGGSRMVAFWPFTEVVRCWFFFCGGCLRRKKKFVILDSHFNRSFRSLKIELGPKF